MYHMRLLLIAALTAEGSVQRGGMHAEGCSSAQGITSVSGSSRRMGRI